MRKSIFFRYEASLCELARLTRKNLQHLEGFDSSWLQWNFAFWGAINECKAVKMFRQTCSRIKNFQNWKLPRTAIICKSSTLFREPADSKNVSTIWWSKNHCIHWFLINTDIHCLLQLRRLQRQICHASRIFMVLKPMELLSSMEIDFGRSSPAFCYPEICEV